MDVHWQQYRNSSPSSPPAAATNAWSTAAKLPARLPTPLTSPCSDCPTPPVLCLSPDKLTAQCTDKCVVITCNDPAHGEMTCDGGDEHAHCDLVCDTATNCTDCHGFDEFLQCCSDYHSHQVNPRGGPENVGWNAGLENPNCCHYLNPIQTNARCEPLSSPGTDSLSFSSPSSSSSPDFLSPPPDIQFSASSYATSSFVPHSPYHTSHSYTSTTYLPSSTPLTTYHSPALRNVYVPYRSRSSLAVRTDAAHAPLDRSLSTEPAALTCQWDACNTPFASASDILRHVNSSHLPLEAFSPNTASTSNAGTATTQKAFACLWRDCDLYPSASSLAAEQDIILNHLFHDHLGLVSGIVPVNGIYRNNSAYQAYPVTDRALPVYGNQYPPEDEYEVLQEKSEPIYELQGQEETNIYAYSQTDQRAYELNYSGHFDADRSQYNMPGILHAPISGHVARGPYSPHGNLSYRDCDTFGPQLQVNNTSVQTTECHGPSAKTDDSSPIFNLQFQNQSHQMDDTPHDALGLFGDQTISACSQSPDPRKLCSPLIQLSPLPPPTSVLTSSPSSNTTQELPFCSSNSHTCLWRVSTSSSSNGLTSPSDAAPAICGLSFASPELLTSHVTAAHIGAGKAQYECFWASCTRHGENGFGSKQKISRHLQSHTGHRPFQCETCKLYFSEAATLQQHMRRHTQEKPYLCDYPGCGKSFAITGALTIHKRTHNGDKPFKCTYCERAFAESSNLSKHLRTHTGARPYACITPGCEKTFARPDQLTRHARVHEKRTLAMALGADSKGFKRKLKEDNEKPMRDSEKLKAGATPEETMQVDDCA